MPRVLRARWMPKINTWMAMGDDGGHLGQRCQVWQLQGVGLWLFICCKDFVVEYCFQTQPCKTMKNIIALLIVTALAGCATPTVVETRKTGDSSLSCEQIKTEVSEAERFEREARKERTVTGTNVAAAILFWPALLGTYSNTEQAINAARERKENLFKLAQNINCKL